MGSLPDGTAAKALVLDASAVINLLGSGQAVECLTALAVPCLIEERTLAEIERHPVPGLCHKQALDALVSTALFSVERMTSDEYLIYLSLISGGTADSLDDGESAAIALAASRSLMVILDDRKARRVHQARFTAAPVASSLWLFCTAGTRAEWPKSRTRQCVEEALRNARMGILNSELSLLRELDL